MIIQYSNNFALIHDLTLWLFAAEPYHNQLARRRHLLNRRISSLIIFALGATLIGGNLIVLPWGENFLEKESSLNALFFGATLCCISLISYFIFPKSTRKSFIRNLAKRSTAQSLLLLPGAITTELTDEGIVSHYDGYRSIYDYAIVERIVRRPTATYILTKKLHRSGGVIPKIFILPHDQIALDLLNDFILTVVQRVQAAKVKEGLPALETIVDEAEY